MVMAGYKQTEVGEIPEDWSARPIGSSFDFKNGLNKAKQFFGYGTPIVNYMDVFNNSELVASDIVGKVDVSNDELRNFSAKYGDVFFTRTSETVDEIGTAAALVEELNNAVFSGFVLRARPKDDVFQVNFRSYCFQSFIVRAQIQSTASYTTRALTNGRLLSDVLVPIPQKPEEQKAIATALSDVDGLIGALEKQIAKKRDIKTATMQQLLTGKKRLPGFGEGKGYKQTELGLIPEDWSVSHFGDVVAPSKRRVNPKISGGGDICVELEHIDQKTGGINGTTLTSSDTSIKSVFSSGDVLFGKLRSYLRKFWLASFDGVCSTEIWVFQPRSDQIIPEYIYQLIQADGFIECASEAYGTHMPRADWSVVKEFSMALPVPEEQEKIANVFKALDNELEALEAKLSKTKVVKLGMMQELLTGRTRLV